jgi:hypothetical protein
MAVYSVPDTYAGKSLAQLNGLNGQGFRSDVLASQLGVGENQPLTSGQSFNLNWNDPGSGEYQWLNKNFGVQSEGDYNLKAATDAQNKAIQPAINSLQASIPETQNLYKSQEDYLKSQQAPLQQRYQNLLDSLTNKENVAKGEINTATSREFGKRGVPLSSGVYDQALLEKYQPTEQYYAGLQKETGLAREQDLMKLAYEISQVPIQQQQALRDIYNSIATVQTGAGKDAISNSIQTTQFGQNLQLQRDQLAQALKIAEMESKGNSTDEELKRAQASYYNALAAGKVSTVNNGWS